ncbi:hypothetical protein V8J82_16920 [Gymnodinialimonas sp. 2305UL16-5]|uniref:hypothetical protein n=1 Tax=Gymnodinialimonas mytili TaxID=3126503 RepID=UPI0030B3CB85
MKRFFLPLALLIGAPSMSVAQTQPANVVAGQILNAFVARDVAQIARFSNAQNASFFGDVLAGEQDDALVFNGIEGRAAANWDGSVLPVRYDDNGRAIIPYAIEASPEALSLNSGADGRLIVLRLSLDGAGDDSWGLDDLRIMPRDRYTALPASR